LYFHLLLGVSFDPVDLTGDLLVEGVKYVILKEIEVPSSFHLHPYCKNASLVERSNDIAEIFKRSPDAEFASHIIRGCFNLSLFEGMTTFWENFHEEDSVVVSVGLISQ
jgi:hypothetical protein